MRISSLLLILSYCTCSTNAFFNQAATSESFHQLSKQAILREQGTDLKEAFPRHHQYYQPTVDGQIAHTQSLEALEAAAQRKSSLSLPLGQHEASSFYPINPPSIPLAVKGPYLNAWLPSGRLPTASPPNIVGNGGYLAGQDASFWTSSYGAEGGYRLGWNGFIRVDGTTYQFQGNSFGRIVREGPNAEQLAMTYTSTRTIFQFKADHVLFNVTFMTPIWPKDYLRQSMPLSYLHFELDRHSARNRSVQMFTDIDERWTTAHEFEYGSIPYTMQWIDHANDTSMYFIQRTRPQILTEHRQRAEWGSSVYAARERKGLSSRNNNNVVAHLEFINTGKVSFDHYPVGGPDNSFSFSVDFDGKGGDDALFAIGHMRSPYVDYIKRNYESNSTTPTSYRQDRYGFWMSEFPQFSDAVAFFINDFENALSHCKKLDAQIEEDSKAVVGGGLIGEMYASITQLSVRQAFATIEITVPYNSTSKRYNTSDTIIFLKEISSNGDMQTVDVFFPQFPLLTYLNPDLLRDLMKPIFEYTESGLYPNKWCVHDLGVYPSAFGHDDGKDEPMQVEESGNMILLTLHYAQMVSKKAANAFLKQHYKILQQWAQFLITDSLVPAEQLSTDDFAGQLANQSNLAIKGIQGIAAMAKIATFLNETKDAKKYDKISSKYIQAFYGFGLNTNNTHINLQYDNEESWGTLYNLVFDKLLNLKLVAEEVYNKQDAFYPTKQNKYGIPLDSRFTWQKTDWAMFASASASAISTRDLWIENLYKFVSNGKTDAPFTDLLETRSGDFPKPPFTPNIHFIARPVVGGHFIHLALKKAMEANEVTDWSYGPPISTSLKSEQEKALRIQEVNRELGPLNIQPTLSGEDNDHYSHLKGDAEVIMRGDDAEQAVFMDTTRSRQTSFKLRGSKVY